MGLGDYFKEFGISSLFGRPYKINRVLFLIFSILFIASIAYIYLLHPYNYVYSACTDNSKDSCKNALYGSPACADTKIKDLPVCTTETIIIDHSKKINYVGEMPPWYIQYYTFEVIGAYLILLIINTLAYNMHLFHKPTDEERNIEIKDFVQKIVLNADGKAIDYENINDKSKDRERENGVKELHSSNGAERAESGDKSEVGISEKDSSENSLEQDEKFVKPVSRSRFRKS